MGISQVYKVFSFPWWSFAAFKAHFRGFELRAEGWERWQGEKRRGGGEEEGQWARILNITYANIQIAKCWSFPHSAFRMEISQVCKAFSFPCWSFAAFKAHLSRFRACYDTRMDLTRRRHFNQTNKTLPKWSPRESLPNWKRKSRVVFVQPAAGLV